MHLLSKGLSDGSVSELQQKYLTPENCWLLDRTKVNRIYYPTSTEQSEDPTAAREDGKSHGFKDKRYERHQKRSRVSPQSFKCFCQSHGQLLINGISQQGTEPQAACGYEE